MDHIWNSLREWLDIWEEQLKNEIDSPDHEFKEKNIKSLHDDIKAIKKAMAAIHTRF
jgi:hypothetical protein